MTTYSQSEFLDCGDRSAEFDLLLLDCLKQRHTLVLKVGDSSVQIEKVRPAEAGEALHRTRIVAETDVVGQALPKLGSRLLLPVLCSVAHLELPAKHVYALRSFNRSIADFFMRNMFYAICRNSDAEFELVPSEGPPSQLGTEFSKRYLWVMRAALDDENLKRRDFAERLLLNTHIDCLSFKDPLLAAGARDIRKNLTNGTHRQQADGLSAAFLQTRQKVMSHFS